MKKLLFFSLLIAHCSLLTANAAVPLPDEYKPSNIAESWAAQNENQMGTIGETETYGATAVTLILGDLISGVLAVIGVLAVYFLVSNGFAYATSYGQQDKIDKAKKGIMWALAGLMVILISYSLIHFVIKIIIATDEGATASWLVHWIA